MELPNVGKAAVLFGDAEIQAWTVRIFYYIVVPNFFPRWICLLP